MVLEKWFIRLETNMKENGKMIRNVGKEQWSGYLIMKNIKESGFKMCHMDMENIFGMTIR